MAKIEKTILINAPVEKVFGFMSQPENLPRIWPSLQEIRNVQSLPNGGYSYDWTYKMAGIRFDGKAEWVEFVKNERILDKNESSIPSTFIWSFQAKEGGTQVTLNVEYTIPGSVTNKLAEPIIHKVNEQEALTVLANLKAYMEG
ncbi:SRPBCC family protein [uncultured Thermanaerothrix sp.]|uniref:SRPBCC family protein n=1 Tax=uncultured Thermanaerothrix sp. TaxID=1195149 RepID=UPI002613BDB4|nr:SRPBCC family protein [uncultured Thermanaerothrix sp.]